VLQHVLQHRRRVGAVAVERAEGRQRLAHSAAHDVLEQLDGGGAVG
jgi:hypothetical protein